MPRASDRRAVIFDWDGTLADSAERTFHCYAEVFREFGIDYDRAAFQRTYSPDWYRTYEDVGLPRECWPEADARWVACFTCEPARLVSGARECLEALASAGRVLGVVSSGDGSRVRGEMEAHGIAALFGVAVCGGETARRKPHPDPLLRALAELGLPASQCAYVGDSPEDVAMAHAAGALALAIPGGFPNHAALAASGPDLLVASLDEALRALVAQPGA
jgi:phosphoglycolate phosphatase